MKGEILGDKESLLQDQGYETLSKVPWFLTVPLNFVILNVQV